MHQKAWCWRRKARVHILCKSRNINYNRRLCDLALTHVQISKTASPCPQLFYFYQYKHSCNLGSRSSDNYLHLLYLPNLHTSFNRCTICIRTIELRKFVELPLRSLFFKYNFFSTNVSPFNGNFGLEKWPWYWRDVFTNKLEVYEISRNKFAINQDYVGWGGWRISFTRMKIWKPGKKVGINRWIFLWKW